MTESSIVFVNWSQYSTVFCCCLGLRKVILDVQLGTNVGLTMGRKKTSLLNSWPICSAYSSYSIPKSFIQTTSEIEASTQYLSQEK